MSKNMETGHVKNVAAFESLINTCASHKDLYKPGNTELSVEELTKRLATSQQLMQLVNDATEGYKSATNEREILFKKVPMLASRVVDALSSSRVSSQTMDDALAIKRRIHGRRAKTVAATTPAAEVVTPADATATVASAKTVSVSQTGFDNMLSHFTKLVTLVSGQSKYKPNEADLAVEGLMAMLTDMRSKNAAAKSSLEDLNKIRNVRNRDLYVGENSLVSTATAVKTYIRSVFGKGTPEVRQAYAHKLTNYKVK
jgi:hypothetical protein